MGFAGVASVIAVYALIFTCDSASWWLILAGARLEGGWLGRLWLVRLIGEAFNAIIPAASLGGKPVKALLLKSRYGVGYGEAAASLVMAKTTNLIGLIIFSAGGLIVIGSFVAEGRAVVEGRVPENYPAWLFWAGLLLALAWFGFAERRQRAA